MGKTHLIIPDSHCSPDQSNERWYALNRLIADREPDVIVDIGDRFDMASLCSYDKGTQKAEGRRYTEDLAAGHESLEIQQEGLAAINSGRKYKIYNPRKIVTLGNHEHRISRAAQEAPELFGFLSVKDLRYEEFGWEFHDFMKPVQVDGVAYCHYFISGVMGRPIGGEHGASNVIRKHFTSSVWGHSHVYDYCERTDTFGKRLQAVNVGCFFEEDYWAGYAGEANKLWRKGITILNDVEDGTFDLEFISVKRLKETYL